MPGTVLGSGDRWMSTDRHSPCPHSIYSLVGRRVINHTITCAKAKVNRRQGTERRGTRLYEKWQGCLCESIETIETNAFIESVHGTECSLYLNVVLPFFWIKELLATQEDYPAPTPWVCHVTQLGPMVWEVTCVISGCALKGKGLSSPSSF